MKQWEVVIGIETHVQLATVSKIFSGASTAFGAAPNTQACAVDLALPGVLPVLNRKAVECAIRFGVAIDAEVAQKSVFARKNYFYPDLPKGYQISQFELPVVTGGSVTINVGGREKVIRLTRAHLEEDAGKSLHEGLETMGVSGIDLNRAGTPLLEIVSEPEMRSAEEAVAYARALHGIVTWIGICDGNMQEGSFRCDANVSVRKLGDEKLGTRCEVKNVNSFRFLERAINYEIRRQIELIEDGGRVVQETRLYDADRDETRSMRSKEDAMDYRYFPDPDLLPLEIGAEQIDAIRRQMPELPQQMRDRFISAYGLSAYDAGWITSTRAQATYFQDTLAALASADSQAAAKQIANWMTSDLAAALNRDGLEIAASQVSAAALAGLLARLADGTLSGKMAKEVFAAMWAGEGSADAVIDARGLKQVSDAGAIEKMVDDVIAANPKSVEEYRAGKEKALNALFGQVMKASNKTANPAQVTEILKRKLSG